MVTRKVENMKKILLLIVMGWVVLVLAACSLPSGARPIASCPEATADLQRLHNPGHGYCLLYPAEYKVEKPNENETILVIGGLLNASDPRVHISVEAAEGGTAAEASEEFMAEFFGGVDIEEFGIERSAITVAGEPAEVLDNLPGQDINRRVIFVHDDLLYSLMFSPVLDNGNQPYQRMETLYSQILDSFAFIPQSDEVVEECLAATADNQLLNNEEHGYCLLLPGEYETERPNENETVFFVGSLMDVAHPKLFITVEDAGGRTAAQAAEELMAEYPPDFGIQPVGGITIGYEWAEQLDNVPGQDISRVVLVEHDGRLYRLTFVPASEDAGEVYRQMEALYDLVLKSFRFLP
jgi:hypothetical protein